jgi:MYXO-CTERM domain-containing protein
MDWIETLFGLSPDGGSGVTEMLYGVALAFVAVFLLGWRRRRVSRRHKN